MAIRNLLFDAEMLGYQKNGFNNFHIFQNT